MKQVMNCHKDNGLLNMISYYVCNRKSYHRAQNMRWRWFRSNDNDEPLRYASRTLLVIRTMKGLRGRT